MPGQKEGRKNRQTLFYRTLLATAEGSKYANRLSHRLYTMYIYLSPGNFLLLQFLCQCRSHFTNFVGCFFHIVGLFFIFVFNTAWTRSSFFFIHCYCKWNASLRKVRCHGATAWITGTTPRFSQWFLTIQKCLVSLLSRYRLKICE